ncbi:MAG: hypothetical protein AAFO84_07455 [Cyanobacteria bacterium J06598_1]
MSLPIVLEIAVGLIFIYLTLSLIASEIQEILSALFQWRAEHLKRSIEQLLAGDDRDVRSSVSAQARQAAVMDGPLSLEQDRVAQETIGLADSLQDNRRAAKELTDRLYASPLIEDLNYEASGGISGLLRTGLHGLGKLYRVMTFSRNVFGDKTSGPSYIPAETFATSLIERLKLEDFQRLLLRSRFTEFLQDEVRLPLHNTVNELRARLENEELLAAETIYFDQSLDQISADLESRRLSLESALEQVVGQLKAFEEMASDLPLSELGADPAIIQSFLGRVRYLHTGISGHSDQNKALIARLRPTLGDIAALLDPSSATYAELVALAQREGEAVQTMLRKLHQEVIPPRLRASLSALANRAEAQVESTGLELTQLQKEIEGWFNNGMERASGVYRRNVKGVGILVGLAIAFTLNADTFYMFERLSKDPAIRSSILQTADQLEVRGINSAEDLSRDLSIDQLSDEIEGDLRLVGLAVEKTLADYPLPLGRTPSVLAAQQAAESNWPVPLIRQRWIGWLITAIALSMGASFWFDLLRKVTSVRSSGNKPK